MGLLKSNFMVVSENIKKRQQISYLSSLIDLHDDDTSRPKHLNKVRFTKIKSKQRN
jgi:hypothetical protein